jgi:hypothetical protein
MGDITMGAIELEDALKDIASTSNNPIYGIYQNQSNAKFTIAEADSLTFQDTEGNSVTFTIDEMKRLKELLIKTFPQDYI